MLQEGLHCFHLARLPIVTQYLNEKGSQRLFGGDVRTIAVDVEESTAHCESVARVLDGLGHKSGSERLLVRRWDNRHRRRLGLIAVNYR